MDAFTSAEAVHLLIDIRDQLEWQSKVMYLVYRTEAIQVGAPPERYTTRTARQDMHDASFRNQYKWIKQQRELRKQEKRNKRNEKKIDNRP